MKNKHPHHFCFHFFEPLAINFCIEICHRIMLSSPKSTISFVVPWPETAELLRKKIPKINKIFILKDPGIEIYTNNDTIDLTLEECKGVRRIESTFVDLTTYILVLMAYILVLMTYIVCFCVLREG